MNDASSPDAERATVRAEIAECLFVMATDFISPERIMKPEVLDTIGQLDSALEVFRKTGVALFDRELRACWEMSLRECPKLQTEGAL